MGSGRNTAPGETESTLKVRHTSAQWATWRKQDRKGAVGHWLESSGGRRGETKAHSSERGQRLFDAHPTELQKKSVHESLNSSLARGWRTFRCLETTAYSDCQ
jgi:hypothetical protein